MDKLGLDILWLIVDELAEVPVHTKLGTDRNPPKLAGYSTLSSLWRLAIERRTFERVRVSSESIDRFATVFSRSISRRSQVREIEFQICLPTKGITKADFQQDHGHFIDSVHSFLSELHGWEVNHPSDILSPLSLRWTCNSRGSGEYDDLQYRYPVITDEEFAKLPIVRRVTSLSTWPGVRRLTGRKAGRFPGPKAKRAMHPKTICQLASLMPQLDNLFIRYLDPGHLVRDLELRIEHRNALAEGLLGLGSTLKQWRNLVLCRDGCYDPLNHSFQCPNLEDENGVDKLCDSIRKIMQKNLLQNLELEHILISPALFSAPDTDSLETWPSIRVLDIACTMVTPSGKWYFRGSPQEVEADWDSAPTSEDGDGEEEDEDEDDDGDEEDDDDDDEDEDEAGQGNRTRRLQANYPRHEWRKELDPELFNPLITDLSLAILKTPNLNRASFIIDNNELEWGGVEFEWDQPGTLMTPKEKMQLTAQEVGRRRWKVVINSGQNWVPHKEALALWEAWGCGILEVNAGKPRFDVEGGPLSGTIQDNRHSTVPQHV